MGVAPEALGGIDDIGIGRQLHVAISLNENVQRLPGNGGRHLDLDQKPVVQLGNRDDGACRPVDAESLAEDTVEAGPVVDPHDIGRALHHIVESAPGCGKDALAMRKDGARLVFKAWRRARGRLRGRKRAGHKYESPGFHGLGVMARRRRGFFGEDGSHRIPPSFAVCWSCSHPFSYFNFSLSAMTFRCSLRGLYLTDSAKKY